MQIRRLRSAQLLPAFSIALAAACGPLPEGDDEHDHDTDDFVSAPGTLEQGLAVAGPWSPPADVRQQAEGYSYPLQDAPPYNGGANCSGGATPGATALRAFLLSAFPQTTGIGIYNCRVIAGSNTMSLHGVGRALDIMIPTVGGAADNGKGDPIATWLLQHGREIGIQRIIWDHRIWGVNRTPHLRDLTSGNMHIDHLHVELNEAGASKQTPWFQASPTVPPPAECQRLPAGQSILENGDDCLALLGPAQYWRTESVGHDGDLAWTNAYSGDTPSNEARWTLRMAQPGRYKLAVWIDDTFGVFTQARYVIRASGAQHAVVINQGASAGWTNLGEFDFAATGTEDVRLGDNAGMTVPSGQHIVVDALRITPVVAEPTPVEPAPDAGPPPAQDAGAAPEPDAGQVPEEPVEEPPPAGEPDAGNSTAPPDAGSTPSPDAGAAPESGGPVGEGASEDPPAEESAPATGGCSSGGVPMESAPLLALLALRRRSRCVTR